jgi:hypothetical protein
MKMVLLIYGCNLNLFLTDYVDMVGASASTVGTHGLVPAPSIGSQNKFLKGEDSWAEVQGIGENN